MKTKLPLVIAAGFAGIILGLPVTASAKDKKTETPATEAASSPAAKMKAISYHGKVAAVDASAKTFTVGKRTFKVTEQTQMTKDGAPATMADLEAGKKVSGSYWKKGDGLEAKSVKIGAKMEETKAADTAKKESKATASPKP